MAAYETKNLKQYATVEDAVNDHIDAGYRITKLHTNGHVSMMRRPAVRLYSDPIADLDDDLPSDEDAVRIVKE